MFERFTDRARRVLHLSQEEAYLLNHNFIGTEHILLGLIHEGEGLAAQSLHSLGVSYEVVFEKVEETIGTLGLARTGSPPFTPRSKKVLEFSLREALFVGHNSIGTEHILLGLLREGQGAGVQILQSLAVSPLRVRERVMSLMDVNSPASYGAESSSYRARVGHHADGSRSAKRLSLGKIPEEDPPRTTSQPWIRRTGVPRRRPVRLRRRPTAALAAERDSRVDRRGDA